MPALFRAIPRNWPLKAAALVLAAILWVIVSAEETTSALVPVRLDVTLPPTLAMTGPPPELRVLVSGPGRELIKLYAATLVVRAAVPATALPPSYLLTVGPGDVELPRNVAVSVQDLEPRELAIELDRVVRRSVPVAFRGVVEAESGFALAGRLAVAPNTVTVTGPRALVYDLDSVRTEPIELRGLTATIEHKVPLDTTGSARISIAPREVTVTARVRRS